MNTDTRTPPAAPLSGRLPEDALPAQSFIDSLEHGLVAMDGKGVVTAINRAARDLMGQPEILVGTTRLAAVATFLDGKERREIRLPTLRSFGRKTQPRPWYRAVLLGAHEEERIVDAVFSPWLSTQGKRSGIILVMQDVGDEVARECLASNRREMETIGVMAKHIAEDFGRWVGVVSGHALRIAETLLPNTRAHREALSILAASENASAIVKRLKGMTAVASPKHDVTIESFPLGEIVGNAITLSQDTRPGSGLSFNIRDFNILNYTVKADPALFLDSLTQVFLKMADTMPGGSITLSAQEKQGTEGPCAILHIGCKGESPGSSRRKRVAPQDAARAIANDEILAIVQNAAKEWGGDVHAEFRKNEGISVFFSLPLARSASSASTVSGTDKPPPTILVADDHDAVLEDVSALLEKRGCTVLTASNARHCLDLYKKNAAHIDLCILDVFMPGRDARYLLRNILAQDPTASIIMMSGFSRDYVRGYLKEGAWSFMQKPIDYPQLAEMIGRILEHRAQHETLSQQQLFKTRTALGPE